MNKFTCSKVSILSAVLTITFFASAALCQDANSLDSRDLLKMMRQKTGEAPKPAYAERTEEQKYDELMNMLPAASLFVVRINNFDNTLSQIDQFLTGISPIPMGLRMLAHMQLAQLLGNPQLTAVNTIGNFAIFAIPDEMSPQPIFVIAVPVTNYQQFVTGNPNLATPDDKGISRINIPKTNTPQNDSNQVNFASIQFGNYALISQNPQNLLNIVTSMSSTKDNGFAATIDPAQAEMAVSTPIWACGNIQIANKSYGSLLDAQLARIKTMTQNIPTNSSQNSAAMMDDSAAAIKKLIAETKFIYLNINPKTDVLKITETVTAMPGTDLATTFVSPSASKESLLKYLKNGAILNLAANTDSPFIKKLIDISGQKISDENQAKLLQLVTEMTNSMGQTAFSISADAKNKPPLASEFATEIKDPQKFNSAIDQIVTSIQSMGVLKNPQMGLNADISIAHNANNYKGISIDSIKLAMQADANSPQAQMMTQMYGQGFDVKTATVGSVYLSAFSSDPETSLHGLIDIAQTAQSKPMASEIQNAMSLIPDANKADFFATLNVLRIAEMLKPMMAMFAPTMSLNIPQSTSNIAFASKADNGKLTVDIALPKQHLSEIAATAMAIQQQIAQQQQQMMQQQQMQQQQMMMQQQRLTAPKQDGMMWTCPMHSNVMMPQPGQCPICGTTLVPAAGAKPDQEASKSNSQLTQKRITLNKTIAANDKEKRAVTKDNLQNLHEAVMQFKMDHGKLPESLSELIAAEPQDPNSASSKGGYIDANEVPKDGWGNEFTYEVSKDYSRGFIIISNGADGQSGGEGYNGDLSTDPQALKRQQRKQRQP